MGFENGSHRPRLISSRGVKAAVESTFKDQKIGRIRISDLKFEISDLRSRM
jgi:hypothetical protein